MKKNSKALFFFFLFVIILLLFGLIMFHELKHGDFPAHIAFAKYFSENGYLYKIPHTLFARGVTIIRALLPANILVWISPFAKQVYDLKSFEISALILMVLTYLFLAYIIANRILNEWKNNSNKVFFWVGIATFTILMAAPIFIFTFPNRMFIGYVNGNRYDSPTYILSKPFVLLFFLAVIDNFENKWNWKQAIIAAVAIICATLSKPSFTITILPALGILLLFSIKNLRKINWGFLIFAVGIPSIIVLIGQFVINYSGNRGDKILIAPFKEILFHVPNLFLVFFLIIMSIAFPILITVFNWSEVKQNLEFRLAWINYFVGQMYGLILCEEINFGLMNFWNCVMIANFVLFFTTVKFWGKDIVKSISNHQKLGAKQMIVSGVLALHLLCGIIYFIATLFNTGVLVV
jgi:hypothetical protein